MAEPDRPEIRLKEVHFVELRVAPEAGEVEGDGGLPALAGSRDEVPAVTGQGAADRRGDRGPFL